MALTLSDLMNPLTYEQIRDTCYGILDDLGFSTTSWRSGGMARTIVALLGRTLAPFTEAQVQAVAGGFLDFASGPWLEVLAKQVYGVDKQHAEFATGFVRVDNAGGGVYSFDPGELRFANPTSGKAYFNTAAVSIGAMQTGVSVAVQAEEIGSGSTSTPGTITTFETPHLGLSCTNDTPLIGTDDETDDSLRIRCRAKIGTISPMGPSLAYDFVARTESLNGGVNVTRTLVVADSDTGDVTVYVADDDGGIDSGDVDKIQDGVDTWATPQSITSTVLSAVPVPVGVTATIYIYASKNLDAPAIQTLVDKALTAYFATIPIGGFPTVPPGTTGRVYVNALEHAIMAAVPAFDVQVTIPASDAVLAIGEVATFSGPSVLTVNIVGGA